MGLHEVLYVFNNTFIAIKGAEIVINNIERILMNKSTLINEKQRSMKYTTSTAWLKMNTLNLKIKELLI